MICNLNIRHTYLNIKINNKWKTMHVWSLTTESNKGRHQYTDNSNLSFSSKKWYFYILQIIVISNLNIRHTYLNIKINNQGKPCMSDHWPLRATKVATSILKIQTKAFLPKMILLESGDHCDLQFKY